MGQPEHYIEGYLTKQAKSYGFLCLKFTAPAVSGVPDRILIANGRTVFIELKAPGKKPRALQLSIIASMRKAGAAVYVIDNRKDIDDLLLYLSKHKSKANANLPTLGL